MNYLQLKEGNSAYCLDVGITNKGEIALIEMTDGFSFGKYGMSDELLAEILITRWNELKNERDWSSYNRKID